jgi:alkanesulfonate monooxygenase SsuD/methylene tetrahydromethanopterin reductase-like flavin-dependent oxidoreductase (luciferase family)
VLQRELAGYGRTRFYNASFARQGYEAEASAIHEAWNHGDRPAAMAAVSSRMIEDMFIFGTKGACRARLAAYREAGLKTPVIIPISVHMDPEVRNERRRQLLAGLISA